MITVSYDQWQGNRDVGRSFEITNKETDRIWEILDRLNGKIHTQILIKNIENALLIGGGNNNLYVCTLMQGNESSHNLINKKYLNENEEVEIVTGGQAGLFPRKLVNEIDQTREAIRYFIEFNKMNPNLIWEKEY